MDRETKENPILEPEQENPEKAGQRQSFPGLRRALKKAYQRFEAARARFVAGRNAFCRTLRGAFDSVAAFFLKIWAVIGPPCKKVAHAVAVAAKAVWKVLGPLLRKLWQWMKPGLLFLGNKIKAGAAYLAARFKALNKPMQIGIGAVSGSLVLLIIALMISSHVSRTALLAAEATPSGDSTLPVVSETQGPTLPPASPTPIPEPLQDKVLKKGDDSPTIAIVQTRLMELGYMDSDEPTEHFGSITEAALIRFQKHNDIQGTGELGEGTWFLLMNEGVEACVMQDGDEGDDVEGVQTRLYELGYLGKNFITGTYGEKTTDAVADFQKANGLASDGMVGHETLEILYADEVVGNFFKKGDTDATIATYQERLKKLGYLANNYKVKGKMDEATINAIRKFQDNNDLTPDGCLGPTTMSAMDDRNAKAYTLSLGMKGSDVKAVQKKLKSLGYLTSNSQVDGYYGDSTEEAVEEFQKRNGLDDDGTVGAKTLEKLNSKDARKAKAPAKEEKESSRTTSKPKATPKATKKTTQKPGKATPKATKKTTEKPGKTPKTTPKATKKATNKPTTKPTATVNPAKRGVEKLIAIAQSKLGCPYVGGAKGPNKFDCSGFVYWCMKQAGFSGGYMTSIGWRSTSRFPRINSMSQIQRGDILVFKGNSMATGHVGIYLGGGRMIDASSGAGQVRITNSVLSGSYWKQHFLMAYRIYK